MPVLTLMAAPYSFDWGAHINAKLIANNQYGSSVESDVGNGAIIMTLPDAPVNLQEVVENRSATSITFTWEAGASNGGDVVIDYRISYAHESNVYTVLAVGITTLEYTATGLNAGLQYKFKVEARNYLYYSQPSNFVQILCATIPSVPSILSTSNEADYIRVAWN